MPSEAAKRRYCNQECYDNSRVVTLAHAMVMALGGPNAVAEKLHVACRSIKSWFHQGIPGRYHLAFISLAKRARLSPDVVTMDNLLATLSYGREYREGRAGRKAAGLPPNPSTIARHKREAKAKLTPTQ